MIGSCVPDDSCTVSCCIHDILHGNTFGEMLCTKDKCRTGVCRINESKGLKCSFDGSDECIFSSGCTKLWQCGDGGWHESMGTVYDHMVEIHCSCLTASFGIVKTVPARSAVLL